MFRRTFTSEHEFLDMGISSWRVSDLNESWHIAGSIDRNADGSGPHEIEARQL